MTVSHPTVIQDGPDVLLAVRIQPRASRNQLVITGNKPEGRVPDSITLYLTAPPVEGAANAASRAFLANVLSIPRSRILLARGDTSRYKVFRIRTADVSGVLIRLQQPPTR